MAYVPVPVGVSAAAPLGTAADVLVWPVFAGEMKQLSAPSAMQAALIRISRAHGFTGEAGGSVVVATHTAAFGSRRPGMPFVAVVGLGERGGGRAGHAEALRRGMGRVVNDARKHSVQHVAITLHDVPDPVWLAGAASEAVHLADYRFVDYSTQLQAQQQRTRLKKVTVLVPAAEQAAARRHLLRSRAVARGVALARDLVNRPAGDMEPKDLVAAALAIAAADDQITVQMMDRAAAAEAGFTAFLAVARGSVAEPYVIHLTWRPSLPSAALPRIFLIGKGITFDSGGLSLKPAQFMEDMKIDMAGAAAVLGVFSSLRDVSPAAEVHGVIATCENMPSGAAYRPGDVIRAKNGKTIEVLNTDAEGRITLADALAYAVEQEPTAIVDIATLTGSCMVTLGETVAGLWSNDDMLRTSLAAAAERSGEQACALPLPSEYRTHLESTVADLRNIGTTRYGDAIHAALFLREFVGQVPWAHLDIAGPAYASSVVLPYHVKGATGYGVRLLAEYLGAL